MFRLSPGLLVPLAVVAALLVALIFVGRVPLRYNLRNLAIRWKTTLTTALAFTAVIGLLVVMLAFVTGMARLTEGAGQPANVMIFSDGATDETFSNLPSSDIADIENQPGIAREGERPLASRETYMVVNQLIEDAPPGRPSRRFLQVRGIDDVAVAATVHDMPLYPGGAWFSAAGVEEVPTGQGGAKTTLIQAVLGEGIARELGRDRPAEELANAKDPGRLVPGDTFRLADRTWIVVGIMQSANATFDSEVWAKRSIIAPVLGKDTYTTIVLRADSPQNARRLKDYFNTEYKKAAVQAQLETEYFASLSETHKQFMFAIVIVTVFLAVGGVFGVVNTMFAAISQRTADIGVLRMLGFARWQILVSFLMESLLIALVGGLAGCALGMMADGWTANSIVGGHGGGKFVVLRLIVDLNSLAAGMLLALAMGALGGIVPAIFAMLLKPLEALR